MTATFIYVLLLAFLLLLKTYLLPYLRRQDSRKMPREFNFNLPKTKDLNSEKKPKTHLLSRLV